MSKTKEKNKFRVAICKTFETIKLQSDYTDCA